MPDPTRENGRLKPQCGLTLSNGRQCRNPEVPGLGVCARHVRERASLLSVAVTPDSDEGANG